MIAIPIKHNRTWTVQPRYLLHNVFVVATVARLGLAFLLAIALHHSGLLAVALLGVIIAADVLDGVLARRLRVDSNIRRATDSTVDMLSTHIVAISFVSMHPSFAILYVPIAIRDAASSLICCIALVQRRELLLGGPWHKCGSLSKAALLIGMLSGHSAAAGLTAVLAWGVNYTLLIDYCGAFFFLRQRDRVHVTHNRRFVCDDLRGLGATLHYSSRLLPMLASSAIVHRAANRKAKGHL